MQFTLQPYGHLNRETASLLVAELERHHHKGYDYFIIDLSQTEPLLLEGLAQLRCLLRGRSFPPVTLKLIDISPNRAAFLQMYGYPIRGNSLLLYSKALSNIHCGYCQAPLRLKGAGRYACPSCKGAFMISEEGEAQLLEQP